MQNAVLIPTTEFKKIGETVENNFQKCILQRLKEMWLLTEERLVWPTT